MRAISDLTRRGFLSGAMATAATGEAAGAAAALAVKAGVVPRRIDRQALVTKLRGSNVFLG